ncbi:DNA endonuclease RBBP8-like isoform X1 [Acanthaster planci]|uniref:DNA endonuclease RBBP8-like isoform X1 n=1 Tax=Acanthaster planci TaxID=133434 RepID=A0A8B7ZL50_ACAPL|nr:DNA endonuclease RBBP8-like isoform X1 [Acanthaster planci]XP_022105776.1 DNA endonuclease RBBP8-like isoform X1 [Acanthaster planci]XP_022105777.1 DNA endonuclease RBBP8-like isoform X1 [Acanthaster planci]
MSSDGQDGAIQLDSLEIPTASYTLSNSTTSQMSSPKVSFTSLLLQIQQFHTTELQKLQDKISRWKMRCNKLAKVSNENASIAKKYYNQNKLLQAKVIDLKHQLRVLPSARHDGVIDTSKMPARSGDQASPKLKTRLANGSPNKNLLKKAFHLPSRLTSKKSNKKVRYSEITSIRSGQNPSIETSQFNISEETQKRASITPSISGMTAQKKTLSICQDSLNQPVAIASQGGNIVVPNTCVSPSIQDPLNLRSSKPGAMMVGQDTSRQTLMSDPITRIKDQIIHTVPETLGLDIDNGTVIEIDDESLIETPTFASTPIVNHSQMSLLSEPVSVQMLNSLQNPGSPRLNNSPVETSKRQPSQIVPLTTSMPRSESQYPVDLNSTQVKSPTFCGEALATPESASGKSWQHSKNDLSRNIPTLYGGDQFGACATDESYQSEASMLLLRPHVPKRFVHPHSSPQDLPDNRVTSMKATILQEACKLKQEGKTSPTYMCSTRMARDMRSPITPASASEEKHEQGTNMMLTLHTNVLRVPTSKKRKLDLDESTVYDDTVCPSHKALGKENSPERLDDTNQTSSDQKSSKQTNQGKELVEKTVAKVQAKGMKNLKQSKLTLKKIKPGMNKSARLMREYNEDSLVNIDSQVDTFINQAIELSLREKNFRGNELGSKDVEEGFKVPNVPQKKQQYPVSLDTGVIKKASHQDVTEADQIDSDLSHILDLTHSPHDLNGTIDPLMDLTRLETGASQSTHQVNLSDRGGSHDHKLLERNLEAHLKAGDRDLNMSEAGDDSCQDLFGDEVNKDKPSEMMEISRDTDEVAFVKNFDVIPKVMDKPNYKYTEVVRKHDERQKLRGFGCKDCEAFYRDLSLTSTQQEMRMKLCSRHRAQSSPTNTPEHYWSVGFPDTQTCLERGYIRESRSPERRSRSKKNKYKKLFAGKEGVNL